MGFLSKLFGGDPWARLPQSFGIAVRRKLSTDEFEKLTTLLRKHEQLRQGFSGVEDPQLSNEDIPAFLAIQLAIFASFATFTEPERELLVDLSLKLEPEENLVWKQKAYILVGQSRFSEAQDAARQALETLKTDSPDTPEADQAMREIERAMGLPEGFDQDAAIDQTTAALKGIVQGRYNLLYFKSRVDSMTYEVMKQVVVGTLQQKGVKLSSEADLEQKGLDPDFQRVLAATAVHSARLSLSDDDQVTAALAYQAANRFDEFNFDAHHALAIFMNHAVQNADESDPEVHVREATRQAWLHAGMALKLMQIPQVRHEIDQAEQKEMALEQILRAHPQP
jgi:tetratricopeptide (TPR) repeat protein